MKHKKIMPDNKNKSWLRKHWILSGILGFFLLFFVIGIFQGINESTYNAKKYSDYSKNGLIVASSNLLLPQDSEIDRIWKINDITFTTINETGFIEGVERKINKVESLESSHVTARAYRFNSVEEANQFYTQEKEKINIRGVEEWGLGSNCFGIEKDVVLSGYAKGFCLRNNIVFYIESVSNSYNYASDGKEFMNIMIKKV
jgi:hypothetical protein